MADELVSRVIEPYSDSCVEPDLAHQYEEREDRVSIVGDDIIHISSQEAHSGLDAVQIGKPRKSDQSHGKTQFDSGCKKEQKQNQA
jgi:hypothetical protein